MKKNVFILDDRAILFVNGSEIDIEKLQFELDRNYSYILNQNIKKLIIISNITV